LFEFPVDGVLNYVGWGSVEPSQGQYRYPGLDRMAKEAAAKGKRFSYHIIPGSHTPDWVFDQCGQERFWQMEGGKRRRTYLPWVTKDGQRVLNTQLLDVWRQTVLAFSRHIHDHPARDRIWFVAITGWPQGNGLELMWGVDRYDDFKQLRWSEGGKELYIEFCQRVVDIYLDAFLDIPLGIAFTDYYGRLPDGTTRRETETSYRIVTYAVTQGNQRGATVIPMGLWSAHPGIIRRPGHPVVKLMRKFRQMAPGIALEGPMGSYKGYASPREQMEFAIKMRASWMQLWHHDVIYDDYQDTLREFRKKFREAAQ